MAIARATFAGTDLDQAFSAQFSSILARRASILMLLNRNWERDARMNDNVIIRNLDFDKDGTADSSIKVTARPLANYKRDYGTPKEFNVNQQTFKIDQGGENSFKLYRHELEKTRSGPGYIRAGVAAMQQKALEDVEDNIITYMAALATYTTDAPAAADLPKDDNTGSNGNAGKIYNKTFGSTSNYLIAGTGEPKNGATQTALLEMFSEIRLRLERQNIVGGTSITGSVGQVFLLVPPEILNGVVLSLQRQKIQADSLNISLYRNFTAFGSAMRTDQINDVNIISTPAIATAAADGGFTMYAMTREAITYAEEVPEFWSQSPRSMGGVNDGPYYSYHQVYSYGRKLVNANQCMKIGFTSKAS